MQLNTVTKGTLRLALVGLLAMSTGLAGAAPVKVWLTSGDQRHLLERQADLPFGGGDAGGAVITVDPARRYQQIVGFGAAITDAAAWLIATRMNADQRSALLQHLFGRADGGVGLSFTRLTIGASDFSRSHYSYDDMPPGQSDPQLAHFSLAAGGAEVLPLVKAALAFNPQLTVMASTWSAPGWMKTSDSLIGGTLKAEAYAPFAAYLLRYVEAAAAEGVPIYALSMNEPHFEPRDYPGMRMDAAARATLFGRHLGPLLASRQPHTRILDWDHNWNEPASPKAVLADPQAAPYVAGVAWHCYAGEVGAQSQVHDAFPDKDTYFTECAGGRWSPQWADNLMYFTRKLVIGSTRGWARGVLLWNLALDQHDGPHLGGCADCRGVVTIDSDSGAVTRNVEYYALAHASRFVRPGARRVASNNTGDLDSVAFRHPDDGSLALVVANGAAAARYFVVRCGGRSFAYTLPARSVATFTWDGPR